MKTKLTFFFLVTGLAVAPALSAAPSTSPSYTIPRDTIDAGGGLARSASYANAGSLRSVGGLPALNYGAGSPTLPIFEPFRHAVGPLIGQTAPGGWIWVAAGPVPTEQPRVVAGALQGVGLAYAAPNRVELRAGDGPSARLPFADAAVAPGASGGAQTNGSIFFSFVLCVPDPSGLSTNGDFFAALTPSAAAEADTPSEAYVRVLLRPAPGGYKVGVVKSSFDPADFVWDPRTFSTNAHVFLVGAYTFAPSTGDDVAWLWVNPSPRSFCDPIAPPTLLTNTAGADATALGSFVYFQRLAPKLPARLQSDELRLGCGWGAVVEPGDDWADAGGLYPTLAVCNGPSHTVVPGIYLGRRVDIECDGIPSMFANGDDTCSLDDEDALLSKTFCRDLPSPFVVEASTNGFLDVWIDLNHDGNWLDADEQVFTSYPLTAGTNYLTLSLPSTAELGFTIARLRFSTTGGLAPTGHANDGEVEDHRVQIGEGLGGMGTGAIGDIDPGPESSSARLLTAVGNTVFLVADDGSHGVELWKSDLTSGETLLVRDIAPGEAASNPAELTTVGNTLFFVADDRLHGRELWKSDGTTAGTVLVKDIRPGTDSSLIKFMVAVGNALFFSATEGTAGEELWKSDGTAAGTLRVKDIQSGGPSSSPESLVAVGDQLFFSASTSTNGEELWKSDGTEAGTVLVKDIKPGSDSSTPLELTAVGDRLFFKAMDTPGFMDYELWVSDGSEARTHRVKNIWPGINPSHPAHLTAVGDTLFFVASDGVNGRELWKSDGTEAGTVLVKDINTNGDAEADLLTGVGVRLFFRANDLVTGHELWVSDGTAAGTVCVKDIWAGGSSSNPRGFTAFGNYVVFSADDGLHGEELWLSDGTDAGTVLVGDLNAGGAGSTPGNLVAVGDRLFFTATEPSIGNELWQGVIIPMPEVDLRVDIDPQTLQVTEGESMVFTITVSNLSSNQATGVVLEDLIPAELVIRRLSSSQGSCDVVSNSVNCRLGTLAPLQTATIVVELGTDSFLAQTFNGHVELEALSPLVHADQLDLDDSNNFLSRRACVARHAYSGYVHGKLFYNDMRQFGNFAWRLDRSGNRGFGRNYDGNASSSTVNWLAALDVTVRLYEIDTIAPGVTLKSLIDTTSVLSDGSYVLEFAGLSDSDPQPEVAIEFELSCAGDNRAFRLDNGGSTPSVFTYWHPDASPDNPYAVTSDDTIFPATAYFGGHSSGYDNVDHQAAMAFATMVDVTRVWHLGDRWIGIRYSYDSGSGTWVGGDSGYRLSDSADPVPFKLDVYGEVQVHMSASIEEGFGRSPVDLDLPIPAGWPNGELPAHEYGHVLHQRTWEWGYGLGKDNSDVWARHWTNSVITYPFTAFKEAWANFVRHATFEQNGLDHQTVDDSCTSEDVELDPSRPYGTFAEGHRYPGNVSWFLCDWHDESFDKDPDLPGAGDHFTAELYSMWQNLQGMWDCASISEREAELDLYDYLDYYLAERKSVVAVGAAEHLRYLELITDLAAQNGIGSLDELTVDDSGVAQTSWSIFSTYGFASEFPRFFQVQAPNYSDGDITIQVTSSADAVVVLDDASGHELARANSAGTGGTEEITYTGVVAGNTYYVRVGPAQYGVTGSYDLEIAFGLVLPATLTTAEGEVMWFNDGASAVSSPDAQWATPVGDVFSESHAHAYIGDHAFAPVDRDCYYLGVPAGCGGSYTFTVTQLSGDVDPVVAVYDASSGTQLGFDDNSGLGNAASLTLTLAESRRYIVAIADADGMGTGDVALEIETPVAAPIHTPPIDDDGKVAPRNIPLLHPFDSAYWKLVAPTTANGTLTVTLSPDDPDLDADMVLFDASGTVLARAATEGTGSSETFTVRGIVPEMAYYLTVLPRDYASTGNFDLDVAFGVFTGSISGTLFEDTDADGAFDTGESGLGGWKVYIDENFNAVRDTGEPFTLTDVTGRYSFNGLPLNTLYYIRLELRTGWQPTTPIYGLHHQFPTLEDPDYPAEDFGVYELNRIGGHVYEDWNGNGVQDPGELSLGSVRVFVDLDNNGSAGPTEPAALTDSVGEFLITNVPAGTYNVRVELPMLLEVTQPTNGFYSVTFGTAQFKRGYAFGLHRPMDFGDAPEGNYHTLMSSGGAYHTILPGFYLGWGVDAELDGHPSSGADGDDLDNEPDEDAVRFIPESPSPGAPVVIEIISSAAGVVDMWIDFNGVNGWEASEHVLNGVVVKGGINTFTSTVPTTATLGTTYARVRLSPSGVSSPDGFGNDGEVEDYKVTIGSACLQVDLDSTGQRFPLAWGANIGPIATGVSTNPPVTVGYHDIGVRFIRTHDYYGPLDMKMMYPDQDANPTLPSSYDFTTSDGVWQAIITNGFLPYFRLGNSYTNRGPYAPTNQTNWIEAAVQVIKHYTNTALWGTNALRYVEIWNEPDNADFWEQDPGSRPKFFSFFTAVAQRLRTEFPDLKLGGPGVTPAAFLSPAGTNYIPEFLDHLRSNNVTLDFLSWHVYSNNPSNYVQAARFYRSCLDSRGFTNTEQHVTEYNTENQTNNDVPLRAGMPGAAINTAAWIAMQQENVALATIYRGTDPELNAPFFYGIFYADAQPKAVALSSKLCNTLAGYSDRLSLSCASPGLWAIAGRRGNDVALLISNPTTNTVPWELSLSGGRVPQSPRLTDIVATSTNATYTNVIYCAFRTNSLAAGPQTIGPWGVQFVTCAVPPELPLYEAFAYAANTGLIGQTHPSELTWVAAGPAGPQQPTVVNGRLQHPGMPYAPPNRVILQPGDGPSARLPFASASVPPGTPGGPVTNDSVYFSFVLRIQDIAGLSTNGDSIAGFTVSPNPESTTPTEAFVRVWLRPAVGGCNLGLAKSSGGFSNVVWDPRALGVTLHLLIVGKYTFGAGADVVRLWVNPLATRFCDPTEPTPALESSVGPDAPSLASFVFFQRPAPSLPALLYLDELRLGRAWLDVVAPGCDFGDAPPPYPTLSADDGGRHTVTPGYCLGHLVDVECNGLPNPDASGDDIDGASDDDGLLTKVFVGNTTCPFEVVASAPGKLDAWIDWDRSGSWLDAGDQVFTNQSLTAGTNHLSLTVPPTAVVGTTFARLRLSSAGGLALTGHAADGECEDHQVQILPGPEAVSLPNPTSGVELYCHIHRPTGFDTNRTYPGLVLVPGGSNPGTSFDDGNRAQSYAELGFIVMHFDPDGRGLSTAGGTYTNEDYGGFLQQDGLRAVLQYLVDLPETDDLNIGILSSSYGITIASGTLARYPHNPGVKFLLDWEGPANRTNTAQPQGHVPHDPRDNAWWQEREASGFISTFVGYYLRVQSEVDHVQTNNDHAILLVNLATHARYGGGGRCVWTRVNSATGLTTNQPNAVYSSTNPPNWIAEDVPTEPVLEQYLLELAAMPPLAESNTAPVLTPIPDQLITESNLLVVFISATDTDTPPQTLTFWLGSNTAAGASIDATNGVFTWRPTAAQASSTNRITVYVTDSGVPPLQATGTFTVVVAPQPRLAIGRGSGNTIVLSLRTLPGLTYRILYKDRLDDPTWLPLGPDLVATGTSLGFTEPIAILSQRFYLVVQVEPLPPLPSPLPPAFSAP